MAEKNGYQKVDSGSYRKLDGDDVIDLGTLFWNIIQGFLKFWWLVILLMAIGAGAFYLKASRIFYMPMYQSSATFTVLTGGASTADSGNGTYNFYYDTTTAGQLARTFPYILSSSASDGCYQGRSGSRGGQRQHFRPGYLRVQHDYHERDKSESGRCQSHSGVCHQGVPGYCQVCHRRYEIQHHRRAYNAG
ncbi:MAG: hypothetical protein ACLUUO_00910 [Sellimonas intestinalis]